MELLLLYTACVILLVSSLYLLRLFADARHNLPPGPRPLPLIGNILDLGAQPHRSLARLAERHGPLMTLRLGAVTTVVASTVFSVDLADDDDDVPGGGSSASASAGDFRGMISEFASVVGVPNVSDFFPVVAPLDLQRLRSRVARVLKWLHATFDVLIERRLRERESGEPPKSDFLDVLLDYRSPEDGQGFDRQTLLFLFMDLFTAGSDTSAITVEWVMAELLQNPESMAKARDELDRVIGSKSEIEESDISQLNYLEAIVKETLRLHPPAPLLLPRQAETTTEVGGYTVPKGTRVLVNVWAIGRDSKVWSEPDKFMPERFLQSEVDLRGRNFEFTPFGSGRRICPGLPLAVRMVHLMLASLLHRFEWSLPPEVEKNGVDMMEKFGMILELATPLKAIATPI
uniref:Cytochrome P450 n=1 Tax=Leersia perrieri TaxID=77586 RepID=A0A0D9VRW4_9ORYZ